MSEVGGAAPQQQQHRPPPEEGRSRPTTAAIAMPVVRNESADSLDRLNPEESDRVSHHQTASRIDGNRVYRAPPTSSSSSGGGGTESSGSIESKSGGGGGGGVHRGGQPPLPPPHMQHHAHEPPPRPRSFLHRPCMLVAKAITWLPVLFISGVVGWSYYAFVIQLNLQIIDSTTEKVLFVTFYHVILGLFMWSYWQTVFAPPCVTPASWKLSTAMLERLNAAKSEEDWKHFLELFVVEMELPVIQRSLQGAIRYCEKCSAIKPDRSHHCSVCGACVLKMDHHCPWVNNCVAFNNYKFFILFLGYALLYCIYLAGCTFKYFIQFWSGELQDHGSGKFHVLFLFFVAIMFCISVSSLFWYHVYLIMYNKSTLEQFRAPYFNGSGSDAIGWSLGKANNFREVFGYNKWLWFVPLTTSVGDGLTFPTRIHHASRSYQSMSQFNAGNGNGVAANASNTGDDFAINMMSNGDGVLNNGVVLSADDRGGAAAVMDDDAEARLTGAAAEARLTAGANGTASVGAMPHKQQMTTVLDSKNGMVKTRIGRP